jgi:DNA-binding TFAR19-related protein (PDSD5 family)
MSLAEEANPDDNERIRKALARRMKAAQMEQQRKELARRYLTTEAYERIMNVRLSNYELYAQLLNLIIAMVQNNRISGKISDPQLRDMISRLTYKHESKIEFKHK